MNFGNESNITSSQVFTEKSHLNNARLDDLLTQLAQQGIFGPCDRLLTLKRVTKTKAPQFQSAIDFVSIVIEVQDSPPATFNVVVKTPNSNMTELMAYMAKITFWNEVQMFKKILPVLEGGELNLFGRLYEGVFQDDPDRLCDSFLVFEDLSLGHELAPFELFLDFPHLSTAVHALGRFHGMSYLKKKAGVDLNSLCAKLEEIVFEEKFAIFWKFGVSRAIGNGIEKDLANRLLEKTENLSALNQPEEPFAVVSHGDFNKNNIFFKYDNENQPIGVKLFDLQMSRYSDPVLDLGFILYMNTNKKVRDDHWTCLLNAYWDGITSVAPQPGFTREECFDNLSKKLLSAVKVVGFFLPAMMSREEIKMEEITSQSDEFATEWMKTVGGDEATRLVREVLEHVDQMGYLKRGIELMESWK